MKKLDIINLFFLIILFILLPFNFLFSEKHLKVCLINSEYSLDPAVEWDIVSSYMVRSVYERLVDIDWTNYKPIPALAEKWETDDGGKSWIFFLKKGIRFQNGEEFDADSVVFSFRRLIDKNYRYYVKEAPAFREIFPYLYKVEKVSKYKVKFYLKEKFSPFVLALSVDSASIISPKAIKKYGANFYRHGAGTGAFQVEYNTSKKVVLKRSKIYRGKTGNVEKIIFSFMNLKKVIDNFEKKRCDMIFSYSLSKLKYLEKLSWVKVKRTPLMSIQFIVFNPKRNHYLKNLYVRKALFHAWNPNILLYEFQNTIKPFSSFFPKGMPGYVEETTIYNFSIKKAKRDMLSSGVKQRIKLEIPILKTAELFASLLTRYGKILKKIGIDLRIVLVEKEKDLNNRFINEEYDMALNGWIYDYPDPDNMMVALFSREMNKYGFPNLAFFLDEKISSLIKEGKSELNYEKRKKIYEKINTIIYKNTYAIPIGINMNITTYRSRIKNVFVSPGGIVDFKRIVIE